MHIKDLSQDLKDELVRVILSELKITIRFYFEKETILTAGTVIKLLERTIDRATHDVDLDDIDNYENFD